MPAKTIMGGTAMRYYDVTILDRATMRCIIRSNPHTWERCLQIRDAYTAVYANHAPLLVIIAPVRHQS